MFLDRLITGKGSDMMKQAFLNHSVAFITKYNTSYNEEQMEKLKYGLEGLYLTITKLVVILLLSFLIGTIKETLILMVLFNVIRYPAFGFHAGRSSECLFFTSIFFLGLPLLSLHLTLNIAIKVGIILTCIVLFLIYAPADTVSGHWQIRKKEPFEKLWPFLQQEFMELAVYWFPIR